MRRLRDEPDQMAALPSPLPALWPGIQVAEKAAMKRAETYAEALILPKGMELLPGTYGGLRGPKRGSHGGYLMPEGVKHPSGKGVRAWYCHYYKTEREHYHPSMELQEACERLYP